MQTNRSGRDNVRVFFALWPSAEMRRSLHQLAGQFQAECGGRCMRADTLHITLLFIGEVEKSRLPALMQAADRVRAAAATIELTQFACWNHNRIGYAAPDVLPPTIAALVDALQREVSASGFAFDARAFKPHVTLLRNVRRGLEAQAFPAMFWPAAEFVLVQSQLSEQGAHYEILQRWALQG